MAWTLFLGLLLVGLVGARAITLRWGRERIEPWGFRYTIVCGIAFFLMFAFSGSPLAGFGIAVAFCVAFSFLKSFMN